MPDDFVPLAERTVGVWSQTYDRESPGRRLRVLAPFFSRVGTVQFSFKPVDWDTLTIPVPPEGAASPPTYGGLKHLVEEAPYYGDVREVLEHCPLRTKDHFRIEDDRRLDGIPEGYQKIITPVAVDPQLHPALFDLAQQIATDLSNACAALDDPDLYYPGAPEGSVEPVPDEHVKFIMWATSRELERETRVPRGSTFGAAKRPPAPIEKLPWHIQRAFVERRRYRYAQYGIDREAYESNRWSVFRVSDDPEWRPEK